ncbi:MAG: AbrB/MazE/SpoVT family DNA-binding domain-containing protein [Candidatus Nomurabacteria bacterium]|jgi:AbrB family looped-hinge helix DNA binding protein|nr:AbrB/MazE/SpoVT family DNA-binding domain-containing protein [Candidatus Nomurabacteria bacterium]
MRHFKDKFEIYGVGKIGPKGQVVIPAEAREQLGLKPGGRVVVAGFPSKKTVVVMDNEAFEEHMEHVRRHHLGFMDEALKNKDKILTEEKFDD